MEPIDVEKYRQQVEDSTPGSLEGEGPETAYYWELFLEGFGGEVVSAMEDGCGEYPECPVCDTRHPYLPWADCRTFRKCIDPDCYVRHLPWETGSDYCGECSRKEG